MNPAHLHLLFTHLPIVGLGYAILLNLFALARKNAEFQKLSLWCYLLLGVVALVAYLTGDDAGKVMMTYPGITENIVEPHENMALAFLVAVILISALAMIALYVTKTREMLLKRFSLYLLIAAMLTGVLGVLTGSTGGAIRHTEIERGISPKVK
jgi:uncharacterized membrane protein